MRQFEAMDVVEAAYDLDARGDAEWLAGLHRASMALLGGEGRAWLALYKLEKDGWTIGEMAFEHQLMAAVCRVFANRTPPAEKRYWVQQPDKHGSWAATMGRADATIPRWWAAREWSIPAVDVRYTQCLDGGDEMVLLGELCPSPVTVDPRLMRLSLELAAHVSAGLRLRRTIGGALLESIQTEAVLDADFRVVHANSTAKSCRETLRVAAIRRDRARIRAVRGDGDTALDLWQGLVDGRWTLVDCFDSDGKRFHLAVRNDPLVANELTRLTEREAQVASMAGQGLANAEIAYNLGLSMSAIAADLSRALKKLRLDRRTDLPWIVQSTARCLQTDAVACGTQRWNVHSLGRLTPAEREVVHGVVKGLSDADIAKRRQVALRTVANQLRSISQKLNVSGRVEIVGALIKGRS